MGIPSNFWMVHRSEKFHSPSRRAVLSRSRSSFYRDADVDTHQANTIRFTSRHAAERAVGTTGGHRDWRCADYRRGRKCLSDRASGSIWSAVTCHRFQSADVSVHSKADIEHESEYALGGRRDCSLFLDRDLQSLRVRGACSKNRIGASRVPVSFQTSKAKTANRAGAMLQNPARCCSCENETLGARRRRFFGCRSSR